MSTINFLEKKSETVNRFEGVSRLVYIMTTLVLVLYVIVISGVLGWWWYWGRQKTMVSAELMALTGQVAELARSEVLARQIESRAGLVMDALARRPIVSEPARVAKDLSMTMQTWTMEQTGKQTIIGDANDLGEVRAVEEQLQQAYGAVRLNSSSWQNGANWTVNVEVSGKVVEP